MRMLACVDLRRSEPEFVVDEAASWAADAGATVDLLFARTGDPSPEHEAGLRALLQRVPEAHRGEALMPEGAAVDVIVKTSANYDLAVIGPREPGPVERVLLGSIAARVVRVARAPVLVVRPRRERTGPLRMLAGVDLQHPEPTASQVATWATRMNAVVDALYVDAMVIPRVGDVELAEQLRREREAYRRSDIAQLERVLGALPYALRGGVRVAEGDPGSALIEVSAEYDLIAVGSEGRTGVSRLLLGSVAESVVRGASVTALVFPPAEGH